MTEYRGRIEAMTGRQAYDIYRTVKLHFTKPDFNMFKTPSVSRISADKFRSRNDWGMFEGWAKKIPDRQRWGMLLVANFAYGNSDVVYGNQSDAFHLETQWQKRAASLGYVINSDFNELEGLSAEFDRMLMFTEDGSVPIVLNEYFKSSVTLETLVALNARLSLVSTWTKKKSIITSLMQPEFLRISKSAGFIRSGTSAINNRVQSFLNSIHYQGSADNTLLHDVQ